MRIIGGVWRSRQIVFDDAPGLRPTPSRARETLFNWLQADIAGSRCLDLYAGSGALGFEAASRGAKRVVQVENNLKAIRKLRENISLLAADQIVLAPMDVGTYLKAPRPLDEKFDLVFLDPPFNENWVEPTCRFLEEHAWLADYAKIYIEAERNFNPVGMPVNWRLLRNKTAGQVSSCLFQRNGEAN